MEILYEKLIKEETRLDNRAGSRTEDDGAQEDARRENRQVSETHGRRYATESIQSRIIARLARVTSRSSI
jgi:hypothetical protein